MRVCVCVCSAHNKPKSLNICQTAKTDNWLAFEMRSPPGTLHINPVHRNALTRALKFVFAFTAWAIRHYFARYINCLTTKNVSVHKSQVRPLGLSDNHNNCGGGAYRLPVLVNVKLFTLVLRFWQCVVWATWCLWSKYKFVVFSKLQAVCCSQFWPAGFFEDFAVFCFIVTSVG